MLRYVVASLSFFLLAGPLAAQENAAPAATPEGAKPAGEVKAEETGEGSEANIKPVVKAEPAKKDDAREGLLGPVRLGVTAAVGFPHPITYAIEALWADTVSGGLSFGNYSVKAGDTSIGISNWDLRGRWHPFGGSFFLGAAFGSQTIDADIKADITVPNTTQKTNAHLKLSVQTTYLTPQLGWFAMWNSGFTLGFDFGYQMALSSKAKDVDASFGSGPDVSSTPEFKKNQDSIKDGAAKFGKVSIPYITLLRLGWLF